MQPHAAASESAIIPSFKDVKTRMKELKQFVHSHTANNGRF